jgi:hypothetical protein
VFIVIITEHIKYTVEKMHSTVNVKAGGTCQVRTQNISFGGGGGATLRLYIYNLCLMLKIAL